MIPLQCSSQPAHSLGEDGLALRGGEGSAESLRKELVLRMLWQNHDAHDLSPLWCSTNNGNQRHRGKREVRVGVGGFQVSKPVGQLFIWLLPHRENWNHISHVAKLYLKSQGKIKPRKGELELSCRRPIYKLSISKNPPFPFFHSISQVISCFRIP